MQHFFPLLSPTYVPDTDTNNVQARSEVERREEYISAMEASIGSDHQLVGLVKQCLHNAPRARPSTEDLRSRVHGIRVQVEGNEHSGVRRQDIPVMSESAALQQRQDNLVTREPAAVQQHVSVCGLLLV